MEKNEYRELSKSTLCRIEEDKRKGYVSPYAAKNESALRRDMRHDNATLLRPAFVRDTEKILHSPYYNRYNDKTQVFSFYKNDDVTRRGLHVQLVSRVARTIGATLGLNSDLIEAVSLGHDIGHTPFGHAGERILSTLSYEHAGRYFDHNVQSVRVLDRIYRHNLTLQTLNGIISHNGEIEAQHYRPSPMDSFTVFDEKTEACYLDNTENLRWVPSTLEGCLMRICDLIAYIGKDRQDAERVGLIPHNGVFTDSGIGVFNAAIIHNIEVDIIENSYGKNEISMSREMYNAIKIAKEENYEYIYKTPFVQAHFKDKILPMMAQIYEKLSEEYDARKESSILYRYHILPIMSHPIHKDCGEKYENESKNAVVCDFIASMTDDFFLDLYRYYFPKSDITIPYVGYFDSL